MLRVMALSYTPPCHDVVFLQEHRALGAELPQAETGGVLGLGQGTKKISAADLLQCDDL
jgi:hypothetical protein